VALIHDSSSVVAVDGPPAAAASGLRRIGPNPFQASTTVRFDLAQRARVALRVYDVAGRLVRTLVGDEELGAGSHALDWDGRDEGGGRLSPGLYFCQLSAGSVRETRRVVLAR